VKRRRGMVAFYVGIGAALILGGVAAYVFREHTTGDRRGDFGLVSRVCTGLNYSILVDGEEVTIVFSEDSDPIALGTLRAMQPEVLWPNAEGKTLFVTGTLARTPQWTPGGPGRAQREKYYAFRLQHWWLDAPFERYVPIPGHEFSDGNIARKVRSAKLTATDFDAALFKDIAMQEIATVDLGVFLRPLPQKNSPQEKTQ